MGGTSDPQAVDFSRRGFLTLQRGRAPRLPWASAESIARNCTRCGACAAACPENIISLTPAGLPSVSFDKAGCTFCGACAQACEAPVFDADRAQPWLLTAIVSIECIETSGVSCRLCEDTCDEQAFRFRPQPGGRTAVSVDEDLCTGCGACVSKCPVAALSVVPPTEGAQPSVT